MSIHDLYVLPDPVKVGDGLVLAQFGAQVGAVRIRGCTLVRQLRSDGTSKGLGIRLPEGVSIARNAKRDLRNEVAEMSGLRID